MDPGYANVMEFSNVLPTALAYGIHIAMLFVQASLAVYLIGSGAHCLFLGDRETPTLLRRLGVVRVAGPEARRHGAVRVDIEEPVTLAQRRRVAASCQANLFDGVVPLYVDTIDDAVNTLYTGKPTRIYFIGRDGRVVYNPGIGPFGFDPDHLEPVIEEYLFSSK